MKQTYKKVLLALMTLILAVCMSALAYAEDGDGSEETPVESAEINYRNLFYYKLVDDELHITRACDDEHFNEEGELDYTDRCMITELTIPETLPVDGSYYPVEYIDGSVWDGTGAFRDCFNLTSVSLPSNLKHIGDKVFEGCTRLVQIELPDGLEYLGCNAFGGCTELKQINLPKDCRTHEYAGEQAYPGPFSNTPSLASIVIEDGRTRIDNAFFENSGITEITIPDSVTEIGNYAFYGTENLKKVNLSADSELQKIGWKAFSGSSITSFYMPDTVNFADVGAFAGCEQLKSVRLSADLTCNDYQTSRGYDTGIFEGCNSLTDIIFPDGLEKIGRCWFFDSPIETITIPATVTEIGESAFRYCLSLSEVKYEEGCSLEKIGDTAFRLDESLKEFNFPETLKTLASYAFEGSGITEAVLPDSLETLYYGAFNNCADLTGVTIPAGMTYEWGGNNGAFEGSNSLKTVVFKEGVTKIDAGLFGWNEGIESMEIPEGVTSIGSRAFRRAYSLKSVTLPASLTEIGSEAFSDCTALETMNFNGSRPKVDSSVCEGVTATVYFGTWDRIPDNWGGDLTFIGETDAQYQTPLKKTGLFSFWSSVTEKKESYDYDYDEAWFFNDNTEYQHGLAKMSVRAAIAAFGSEDTSGPETIRELMEGEDSLGFENTVYHYPTPEYNTIGYAIGSKNIQNSDGKRCSLLMVGVRGGGYKNEWGGNFDLGTGITDHDGFLYAAKQVKSGIKDYLETYGDVLDPNVKVWIFGYSRAAATANLTAALLDRGEVSAVKPKNVYAYCFECPQNTTNLSTSDSMYSNIFSIVNPIDPVPKVAMSKWGFRRFGTTYYLPGLETNYKYIGLRSEMRKFYSAFVTENAPEKLGAVFMEGTGQASILDTLMDNLAEVAENRDNYYYKHQANLMVAVAAKLGEGRWDLGSLIPALVDIFPSLLTKHPVNTSVVLAMAAPGLIYMSPLGVAHYPELCMFWLDSLSRDMVVNGSKKYKYWFNNCPTDVKIYNRDNELVASFVNDEAQEIEDGVAAYVDDNGQKVVVLPSDGDYHFEISAREAGDMSYTLAEYDIDSGRYDHVTSFTGLEIEGGDVYTGDVKSDEYDETPTLYKNGSEEITPNIDEKGDDVHTWGVTVKTIGNGTATGGGSFVSGAYSGHKATADKGWKFAGWYKDDQLVSESPEYRFCVTEDTELTARFDAIKVSKITISGISGKIAAGRKIKLTAKVLPTNAFNKKLTWKSSNTKIATVTQTGSVTVKKSAKPGSTVKITAAAKDGSGRKAVWTIKVMKGVVTKITVKGYKSTLKAGRTMQLRAAVSATKGTPVNKTLKWTSSNKKYATVTSKGKVKALKAGKGKTVKITVTATDGSGKKVVKRIRIK